MHRVAAIVARSRRDTRVFGPVYFAAAPWPSLFMRFLRQDGVTEPCNKGLVCSGNRMLVFLPGVVVDFDK